MATLFTTIGMETGNLSEWSSTTTATDYTLSATTGSKQSGTYGAEATATSASDTSDGACGVKTFSAPASNVVVSDAWLQFATYTSDGYETVTSKSLMLLFAGGVGMVAWLAIRGTRMVELCYTDTGFSTVASGYTLTMSAATWYLLRVIHDKSAGSLVFKWSTDGSSFTTVGTVASGVRTDSVDEVRIGIVHAGQFEAANYKIYADNVTAYDAEPAAAAGQPTALRWVNIPHAGARIQRGGL